MIYSSCEYKAKPINITEESIMAEAKTAPKGGKTKETKPAPTPTTLSTGKVTTDPTVEITCAEKGCSKKRVIKKQDKFQVKFCLEHQKENRNRLRRERRKKNAKGKTKAPAKAKATAKA
jgi:hypothetical protein